MPNNQDLIDAHISGKIDARDNKAPDSDIEPGYSDNVFYLRGYHEEKKRMAKELHDGLGQLLTAAKLSLTQVDKNLKTQDNNILLASEIIETAITESKRIAYGLLPSVLQDFGLGPGLRKIVKFLSVNTSTKIVFSTKL